MKIFFIGYSNREDTVSMQNTTNEHNSVNNADGVMALVLCMLPDSIKD